MPLIRLLRIPHWIKNVFVVLPAFFAGSLTRLEHPDVFVAGVLAFCLAASSVYALNDIVDRQEDQKHPDKNKRPVASGQVPLSTAWIVSVVCLAVGALAALFAGTQFLFIVLGYFGLNVLYTVWLKKIPVLDIAVVAAGFVFRIEGGGILADVPVSKWLILMTFLLALFMALGKRRDDVLILQNTGMQTRKSIDGYNLEFINASMVLMASVVIVSYIMYTASDEVIHRIGTGNLYLSAIPVILGVLRYLQITLVEQKSASPTNILFRDRFLQLVLLGWILYFCFVLYR